MAVAVPALAVLALVAGARPVAAVCVAPAVVAEGTEVAGQLVVRGEHFGEDCYDTGPPPEGQGTLGRPRHDIELVITQGAVEHVVARGDADDEYRFEVTVTVPAGLVPGEAALTARWADGGATAAVPILVPTPPPTPPTTAPGEPAAPATSAAPAAPAEVATFGPVDVAPERDDVGFGAAGGDGGVGRIAGHFVVAVAIGAAVMAAHQRRRPSPSGAGAAVDPQLP